MPQIIHARRTPIGMKFRIWSPEEGRYVSSELVQNIVREHLIRVLGNVDAVDVMLRRALAGGTSEQGKRRDTDGDWDKEQHATVAVAPAK